MMRGIWRVWTLASLAWIAWSVWNSHLTCALKPLGIGLQARWWCDAELVNPMPAHLGSAIEALTPPLIGAMVVAGIRWIVAGFGGEVSK